MLPSAVKASLLAVDVDFRLPPTQDALYIHMERANFQSYEWKHALENNSRQDPEGHGWIKRMKRSLLNGLDKSLPLNWC